MGFRPTVGGGGAGVTDHALLTDVLPDQHHAEDHSDAEHSDGPNSKPGHAHTHAATTGQTADDHHSAAHGHTHASTSGQTANDHHPQAHTHTHAAATGQTADDHHPQVHAHVMTVVTDAGDRAGVATDEIVLMSGSTKTYTAPTAVGQGHPIYVKNTGTGVVTVACTGAQTIDGATTVILSPNDSITIASNNANWFVV